MKKEKLTGNLAQVKIKMSEKGATGRMGLSWLVHCMEHLGGGEITEGGGVKTSSNRETSFFERMMSGVMLRVAGGD